jgi:hypothetical protein
VAAARATGHHRQVDWIAEATGRGGVFSQEQAAEPIIAQCMQDAGFQYMPLDFPERDQEDVLVSREYREQWGFGITTGAPERSDVHEATGRNPNEQ